MKNCPQCEDYKAALRSIWYTYLEIIRRVGKGRMSGPSLNAAVDYIGRKAWDTLKEAEQRKGDSTMSDRPKSAMQIIGEQVDPPCKMCGGIQIKRVGLIDLLGPIPKMQRYWWCGRCNASTYHWDELIVGPDDAYAHAVWNEAQPNEKAKGGDSE